MTNRRSSNRRKQPRAEVNWPVTIINKELVLPGRVKNLSRGGALLYLQEGIDRQENIRIAIEIPKYDHVISARGEVVRSFPLGQENAPFAFAVGVRFTEISNEDLKFFSGNLAPEWHNDYKEQQVLASARPTVMNKIAVGLIGIIFLALMIYAFSVYNDGRVSPSQIAAFERSLEDIKSQLITIQKEGLSNKNISEQIDNIQKELSGIKKDFVTVESIEKLQQKIINNIESNTVFSRIATNEYSETSESNLNEKPTLPSDPVYHIVKRGENLYRIARKYRLDLDKIREMNNLSPNESIRPNQKLLVN